MPKVQDQPILNVPPHDPWVVDTPSREPVTVFFGLVAVSEKFDRPFGPRDIEVHATLPTSSPLAANAYTGLELVDRKSVV